MIILIGGEKGGTGKTTLATNLAAMRARAGRDVLLLDTDRQGSASYWAQFRVEEEHSPPVPCVSKFGKGIPAQVRDLAKRYDDIVIDAGGRDSVELRSSLIVANRAYIPLQASQFDIWTLGHMDDLVQSAQGFNPELEAFVVLNRASTHPSMTEVSEAQEALGDFEQVGLASSVVRERVAYRKAARSGVCVGELDPQDLKALAEIEAFYSEVFNG
ncbi:MAG: chromosome partitioning protein [Myxococcales bacterium FL481]|nr:MAG: chromosome partitioning protein [Myxococcales bacterium FL481]